MESSLKSLILERISEFTLSLSNTKDLLLQELDNQVDFFLESLKSNIKRSIKERVIEKSISPIINELRDISDSINSRTEQELLKLKGLFAQRKYYDNSYWNKGIKDSISQLEKDFATSLDKISCIEPLSIDKMETTPTCINIPWTSWIRCVLFTNTTNQLLTSSDDKEIRLWDTITTTPIFEFPTVHKDYVLNLALTSDDTRLVSGDALYTLIVWNFKTRTQIYKIKSDSHSGSQSLKISYDNKFLFTTCYSHSINLWNLKKYKQLSVIKRVYAPGGSGLFPLALFKTRSQFLSPYKIGHKKSESLQVARWKIGSKKPVMIYKSEHKAQYLFSIVLNHKEDVFVYSNQDFEVFLTNVYTGETLWKYGNKVTVRAFYFFRDGERSIHNGSDNTLDIWSLDFKCIISSLEYNKNGSIMTIDVSKDEKTIAVGTNGKEIKIYKYNS